jgi:hypothetical protein
MDVIVNDNQNERSIIKMITVVGLNESNLTKHNETDEITEYIECIDLVLSNTNIDLESNLVNFVNIRL